MRTEDLISTLATNAGPAPRAAVARRLTPAIAFGLAVSVVLSLALLGPVRDLAVPGVGYWVKLVYASALIATGAWLTGRLSRPAARIGPAALTLGTVLLAMGAAGATVLASVPEVARSEQIWGHSALMCPIAVFALSMPALAATLWAVRGLAPTNPRAAGFAAGMVAGAAGAAGYALACTEHSMTFIALWYTLGIVLCGVAGAVLAPRFLRW